MKDVTDAAVSNGGEMRRSGVLTVNSDSHSNSSSCDGVSDFVEARSITGDNDGETTICLGVQTRGFEAVLGAASDS